MSARLYQRTIPLAIVTISIIVFLIAYYFPGFGLSPVVTGLTKWTTIITAIAYWMGAASVAIMYGRRTMRRATGWYFDGWVLVTMFGTILLGLILGLNNEIYTSLVSATVSNFGILLYAMMVPFLFSAAFRALRARSIESTVLIISMVIVYLGQSPAGAEMLPVTETMKEFINKSFATGTGRAVLIANALGSAVLAVRAILGKEPGLLGRVETKEGA
jgi:hypothetical protein